MSFPVYLIVPCIWICLLLIALILLIGANIKLAYNLIDLNKKAKKFAEMVVKRTQNKVSKIGSLSPTELDEYLSKLYSGFLITVTEISISEKDPYADGKLYAASVQAMLDFLGPETLRAIEYYYGEGYVIRWCEFRYKWLDNQGLLTQIINKSAKIESVEKAFK